VIKSVLYTLKRIIKSWFWPYTGVNEVEISLDLDADALYIKFQEGKFAKNKKIDEDTVIDFDKEGRLLGIEMLNVTRKISIENLSDVSVKLPLNTGIWDFCLDFSLFCLKETTRIIFRLFFYIIKLGRFQVMKTYEIECADVFGQLSGSLLASLMNLHSK